jgi:IS4 transposase
VPAEYHVDESTGLRGDQRITLTQRYSLQKYPEPLRRVQFHDDVHCVDLAFLTNRWDLPALTIAQIYKQRWRIELFFKWLKQNLSIKHFFGNSINAVKSQIWIAVCVYLTALIAHKTLKLDLSLQLLLHLIEVNMFEKISIVEMIKIAQSTDSDSALDSQMELL